MSPKHLLCLLFGIVTHAASSQPYQSLFGSESTIWRYYAYNLGTEFTGDAFTVGDSTINGFVYKQIRSLRMLNTTGGFRGALIREDTSIGHVWYKAILSTDTSEYLMYRYDLNPGDSFNIKPGGITAMSAGTDRSTWSRVDSVAYVDGRKYIYFRSAGSQTEPFAIIEGIGSTQGVLFNMTSSIELTQYLLCTYKDSVQTSFRNRYFKGSCELPVSVRPVSTQKIEILPNPVRSELKIHTDAKVARVEIIDGTGRIVVSKSSPKGNMIDTEDLLPGVYFLRVFTPLSCESFRFVRTE